jgi:hypothetical protein
MTYKPNLSRMARLAVGARLPAPGQDPLREEELRIELTEEFKPEGLIEKIWVEDIAYRVAAIEVIRAQIAGFKYRVAKKTYGELIGWDATVDKLELEQDERVYSAVDRAVLAMRSGHEFMAPDRGNFLDGPSFALLMGSMNQDDLAQLRQFQVYEHEEVRERDRIVNQFERRRRVAMRHAIELVEARRRAGLEPAEPAPDRAAEATLTFAPGTSDLEHDDDGIDASAPRMGEDEAE